MGNEKSNSYWEAELPPNYDRVGIENFIRAKYVLCGLPLIFHFFSMKYALVKIQFSDTLFHEFKINLRYEDQRWDGRPKSPVREQGEQTSAAQWQKPAERSSYGYNRNPEKVAEDRKKYQPRSSNSSIPAAKISLPVPPKGPEPVCVANFLLLAFLCLIP